MTNKKRTFNSENIKIVENAVKIAEELVLNSYKLSTNQWLRLKYDIMTTQNLEQNEIIAGPFAQIIRYEGKHKDSNLGTSAYDFYKICLQDHNILQALQNTLVLELYPFALYIVVHELIHIVRFNKFLQNFNASMKEKLQEEKRVHDKTYEILRKIKFKGLDNVLIFFTNMQIPIEGLRNH
jgi:hypothetical protein